MTKDTPRMFAAYKQAIAGMDALPAPQAPLTVVSAALKPILAEAEKIERELQERGEAAQITPLLNVAENAANTLSRLGHTFSSTNFTDRYGDGPLCLGLASRLREEIKAVQDCSTSPQIIKDAP